MPKSTSLTPEQRRLRASLAAHERWAGTDDPAAATAPAREAFQDRFLRLAREKYGDLPEADLARRAEHLRRAHFRRMALASSKARSRKAVAPAEQDGGEAA